MKKILRLIACAAFVVGIAAACKKQTDAPAKKDGEMKKEAPADAEKKDGEGSEKKEEAKGE